MPPAPGGQIRPLVVVRAQRGEEPSTPNEEARMEDAEDVVMQDAQDAQGDAAMEDAEKVPAGQPPDSMELHRRRRPPPRTITT